MNGFYGVQTVALSGDDEVKLLEGLAGDDQGVALGGQWLSLY